jgi:hypothetical protein
LFRLLQDTLSSRPSATDDRRSPIVKISCPDARAEKNRHGRHVETGATVDRAETATWLASEDGKDFVRRSSEDWCRASIATGTDEVAARAAAERTTAFYTGMHKG